MPILSSKNEGKQPMEVQAMLKNLFVNTMTSNGYDKEDAKKTVIDRYKESDIYQVKEALTFEAYSNRYSEEDINELRKFMEED